MIVLILITIHVMIITYTMLVLILITYTDNDSINNMLLQSMIIMSFHVNMHIYNTGS